MDGCGHTLSDQERNATQQEITTLESIIHSQRKLSTEIWQQIFLHACIDPSYDASKAFFDGQSHPPWSLLNVCQDWDAYVRGYSWLWTYMSIQIVPGMDIRQHPDQLHRLEEHLQLSNQQSLTVDLHFEGRPSPSDLELYSVLQPSFARWEDVFIYAPHSMISSLFGEAAHFPLLTTLHVEISHLPSLLQGSIAIYAPLLSDLYGRPPSVEQFEFVHDSITSYQAFALVSSMDQLFWGGVYQDDVMPLLANFSYLSTLRVRARSFGIDASLPPLYSSTVTELQCNFYMLPYLQCPNLIRFDLAADLTDFSMAKAPRLIRFLRTNGKHIQHLTIRDPRFKIPLSKLVVALPSLHHIHMIESLRSSSDHAATCSHPLFLELPQAEQARISSIVFHFDVPFSDPFENALLLNNDGFLADSDSDDESVY